MIKKYITKHYLTCINKTPVCAHKTIKKYCRMQKTS